MDPQEAMSNIREVIHRYHIFGEQAGGTNEKAFRSLMRKGDYIAELIVYAENGGNNKAEDSGE